MIPWLAVIGFEVGRSRYRLRLWVPLLIVWLCLLPLVLLLLPFFFIACWCVGLGGFRTGGVLLSTLAALRGTRIEVQDADVPYIFVEIR